MDANSAKAAPAPQPDRILRDALGALAAPASPVPDATTVSSAVPAAAAAPSDGRVVALPIAQAIATGGDTLLGRMLTRASLADQGPSTPVAGPILATAVKGGSNGAAQPEPVTNPLGLAAAAGNGTSPTAVLDAFAAAFATELARSEANGSARRDGASTIAVGAAQVAANDPSQPSMPFAIPIAHDTLPVAPAPPAPAPSQSSHVDANAVIEQILRGMAIRTTDGQSEVRLRLVPEQLGDVSVRLIVSGGSVDASITAHTADAQNALAGGQNQLAKTLADAGLKLQSFTVGLAGGGLADTRDQSRPNDSWNRANLRRINGVDSTEADETDGAESLAVPSFGPPIYSARSLPGAFNRLV